MNSIIKGAIIGMLIGAVIGFLPGVIAGFFGSGYLGATVGHDASSLIRWLGLLIGGGSGAIIGAMHATTMIEGEADVVPMGDGK
ncbi:MAG: hypothetical protein JNM56_33295 [Planctomycetia bacterium]|nr:hypothetical protein [Planctomycetia bacterium]